MLQDKIQDRGNSEVEVVRTASGEKVKVARNHTQGTWLKLLHVLIYR